MHDELTAYGTARWNQVDALAHWHGIAAPIPLGAAVRAALSRELRWHESVDPRVARYVVLQWQATLGRLLATALARRESMAAEIALLFVLNACGRETETIGEIAWPHAKVFGRWLTALEPGGVGSQRNIVLRHLDRIDLRKQDLHDCNLAHACFSGGMLAGARFSGACLRGADLSLADAADCDFLGVDLRGASCQGANLLRSALREANLHGASLREANLTDACLMHADLRNVDMRGACLKGASLHGANMHGTILDDVDLRSAGVAGTRLRSPPARRLQR
jgi:uncharacterized protein YjbI with pentapeptide repeats